MSSSMRIALIWLIPIIIRALELSSENQAIDHVAVF